MKKNRKITIWRNPHQESSIYSSSAVNDELNFKKINGKDLSFNNYNDIYAGLEILDSEKKIPKRLLLNTQTHVE